MKHRLFKLVLFLLLGAIVNVAVAWGCATSHSNIPPVGDLINDVMTATDFDKVRLQLNASDYPSDSSYLSVVLEYQGYDWSVTSMEIQSYISGKTWTKSWDEMRGPHVIITRILSEGIEQRFVIHGGFAPPQLSGLSFFGNYGLAQRLVGWPFKSLYYNPSYFITSKRNLVTSRQQTKEEYVWRKPNVFSKLFPSSDEIIMPYGMCWLGFAINTIFYAVIVWLLWSSPFVARRFIRHKRGHCIKCGYDLRGSSGGCPECGWGRETEG